MNYGIYSKTPLEAKFSTQFRGIRDDASPEVVFSVGGDGTFLKSVRKYQTMLDDVVFVGINTGKLGFYNDFLTNELELIYKLLDDKNNHLIEYSLIDCVITTENGTFNDFALNEVAITNPIQTQIIDVYLNDEYFETFRGTGFLISTPSGSTAYNKSLGGCVIDSGIKGIQLTEIAPINNRIYNTLNSSFLLNENVKITLKIHNNRYSFISVDGFDGNYHDLLEVTLTISCKKVKVLTKGKPYYTRVKQAFLDK